MLIDDLVATGGTLSAGISCVQQAGGIVAECACVVELKMFIDPPADSGALYIYIIHYMRTHTRHGRRWLFLGAFIRT